MDCFVCYDCLANEDEIKSGICDICFAESQRQPFELFVKFATERLLARHSKHSKHPADLF